MPDGLFVVINICGVRAHAEELVHTCRSFPVIGIQETGFWDQDTARRTLNRLFPNHRTICLAPQDAEGAGCALLVHRHTRLRSTFERTASRHRLQGVEVETRGRLVRLASLYAPPASSGHILDPSFLTEGLDRRCAVLAGDLNARSTALGCRTDNANGNTLADYILGEGGHDATVLTNPSSPSFVHRSTPFADTLDWALATPAASRFLTAKFGENVGSDHLPVSLFFATPGPIPTASTTTIRRWRTTKVADWGPFRMAADRALEESGLDGLAPPTTPEELEDAVGRLEDALTDAADATLQRSKPLSDTARLPFPWMVVQLVKLRNRLRRQLARRPTQDLRKRLSVARAALQKELEAHRTARIEAKARLFAAGPSRQSRDFWQAVKRWFRTPSSELPALRTRDGDEATTPDERAEVFATHLEAALGGVDDPSFDAAFLRSTEEEIAADPDLQPIANDQPHADTPEDSTDRDDEDPAHDVTTAEVWLQQRALRAGKAPGLDGLAPDILRQCSLRVLSVLAALFTSSLRMGFIPKRWRHSAICLLPKPGKRLTSPADFRPIALCSCVGKMLERLFARRLQRECLRRHILPPEQSAFLPGRDTTEQLVLLAQRAGQAMNAGLTTAVIALDANKAFDSVWHAGLLRTLKERQFSAHSRRWVAAFLRDRTAAALEQGHLSRRFPVTAGVPQGSPLSPLLYIIYTAEMPLPRGPRTGASLYADDVAMWACGHSPSAALQRLRPVLHRAVRWGRRWRIAFNPAKTQVGFISRRSHWPLDDLSPPHLLGVEQTWAEHVDLLGVRLDRRLSLIAHTNRLQQKVAPRALQLRQWTWAYRSVPNWVGALLFRALLRPIYTYAAPLLLSAAPTAHRQLQRLERRGLRAALRRGVDCRDAELHARGQVGPLQDHIKDLGGRFLVRQAQDGNARVLRGFRTLAGQHPDRARYDLPLERQYACLDANDRHRIDEALFRAGVFPGYNDGDQHPGRNRRASAEEDQWGISPFS